MFAQKSISLSTFVHIIPTTSRVYHVDPTHYSYYMYSYCDAIFVSTFPRKNEEEEEEGGGGAEEDFFIS